MRWIYTSCLFAAAMIMVGCANEVANTPTGSASANPVENYKDQRMREAMRGLDYSSGRVVLTREAATIASRGTTAEAAKLDREADQLFDKNDFPVTIAAYTKAVIVDPTRAETYLGLSQALLGKGKESEAQAALRTALDLEPNNLQAHVLLARTIDRKGVSEPTIDAWNEVLAIDAKHGEAHARIAIATYYQGDAVGSLRHIESAEKNGGEVPAHFKSMVVAEVAAKNP